MCTICKSYKKALLVHVCNSIYSYIVLFNANKELSNISLIHYKKQGYLHLLAYKVD
jgi:hypothetical protein